MQIRTIVVGVALGTVAALAIQVSPAAAASAPTVTALSVTHGNTAGKTVVTVTGKNFTKVKTVKFGATAGTSVNVKSTTKLTVTSPAHAAGTIDLRVTTAAGTTKVVTADHFLYAATPSITAVAPTYGAIGGGTSVTVTGKNFTGVTAVKFGTTAGTKVSVKSATQLTVTAPAHASGSSDVRVTAAGGTSPIVTADQFLFVGTPTISYFQPYAGPVTGGTKVAIVGTGLTGVTGVTVAGLSVPFSTDSATKILYFTAPAHVAGKADVRVTAVGGTSVAASFVYADPPVITSVSPAYAPANTHAGFVIHGTNFESAKGISIDGVMVDEPLFWSLQDKNEIVVSLPAHNAGVFHFRVITAGGTSEITPAATVTFYAAPVITALTPASGPTTGDTTVAITGTNLAGVSKVTVVDVAVPISTDVDTGAVSFVTPAHAAGPVDVQVTALGGTASSTFTYTDTP